LLVQREPVHAGGHYVRQFRRERGLASEGFAIAAEAESTPDESRLARIEVRIDLGPSLTSVKLGLGSMALDEAARKDLLAAAERCKIHNTLKAACPVTISLAQRRSPDDVPAANSSCCG